MQHSAKQAGKELDIDLLRTRRRHPRCHDRRNRGQLAQMGVQFGAGTVMMKFSRDDEAQADAVGAIILYKAGYNPQAMADFFKTLEDPGRQLRRNG